MKISVDASKYSDSSIPVPADVYSVVCKSFELSVKDEAEFKKVRAEGKYPYFKASFEIIEGPYAARRVFANMTINPEPTSNGNSKNFLLVNYLKIMGLLEGDSLDDIDPKELAEDLINKEVKIKVAVKDNEYNGEVRQQNNIQKFLSPD